MRLCLWLGALLVAACGAPLCPAGTTWGTSCLECGPTDACLRSQASCLANCGDGGACAPGTYCFAGVCKNVCG